MIRLLSLTAALALSPLSSASAGALAAPQEDRAEAAESKAEARLETAAAAFEARMEAFGKRAEAISEDESLDEAVRGQRIAALWSEYAPDVAAFTAEATRHASEAAAEAYRAAATRWPDDPRPLLALGNQAYARGERDVLKRGELGHQLIVLEDEAHATAER